MTTPIWADGGDGFKAMRNAVINLFLVLVL